MVTLLDFTAFVSLVLVAADFVRPMTRTTKKAIDALSDDDIRLWTAFWQGDGSFYYASGCRLAQSLRNAPAMLAWADSST
jgi:hypothetical protein